MKRFILLLALLFCVVAYAQTETTEWYINGELYATTSCESGGNIDVPTPPENFGYNFEGWEPAIYDMSTLDTTINGSSLSASSKSWTVMFSYGTVSGTYLCSSSKSNPYTEDTGSSCWCSLTTFKPTGSDKIYQASTYNRWVYDRENCGNCAADCAQYVKNGSNNSLRRRLYTAN